MNAKNLKDVLDHDCSDDVDEYPTFGEIPRIDWYEYVKLNLTVS